MRKIIYFLLPLIFASILFGAYIILQSMLEKGKGALQVTANPASEVYLDGALIGKTPLCKCEAKEMISTGEYTLKIVPQSQNSFPYEEKIQVNKGVLTVIDRTFDPNNFSYGSVITLTPITNNVSTELFTTSFPVGAKVSLDGKEIGNTPILLSNLISSDHELDLSEEGYASKSIKIHAIKGYKLSVVLTLPPSITSTNSAEVSTPSAGINSSGNLATPSSTTSSQKQIVILDTPTGFLRVRDTSSLTGSEIAQVTPGQKFSFIDQTPGWYEIQLEDGRKGWISSQYAQIEK